MMQLVIKTYDSIEGVQIKGNYLPEFAEILSEEAVLFVRELHQHFNGKRKELLAKREVRQKEIDKGILPDFLPETAEIRDSAWTVAPLPADLQDRRVEITGPVERKMIINALNSGAKVFMADFEDSNSPTWENTIQGQINLKEAIEGTISFYNSANGKYYQLKEKTATLMVRPRAWHLEEKHLSFEGEIASGSLVDFGLYFFHNAQKLIEKGTAPYFYLPKLESHLEARLWNEVFVFAQNYLNIPQGTIKATVLVETILASFELNEILYELREHSAGLNCGRWDYIFSFIKKFRNLKGFVLPDRAQVTMTVPFMEAYYRLVIQTCHKRNAPAMGGMAAQIPIKNNPEANEIALAKVKSDKLREVMEGHDGTWVAHPDLVPVAMDIFNLYMQTPNQIFKQRPDVEVNAKDLLAVPAGTITEEGLRNNISVGILYIESWLRGQGAVAIYNLMEDAATAEIARTQVWQWLHSQAVLEDGRTISLELYQQIHAEELQKIREMLGMEKYLIGEYAKAAELFAQWVQNEEYIEFLTLAAYNFID